MALGNTSAGGAAEVRTDGWLLLGEDRDVTIVVYRVTEHIAPKLWSRVPKPDDKPAPGVTADFAFLTGPRKGESIGSETVINAGIVNPMLKVKVGNVAVARVGTYPSRGRSHPCFNPASSVELAAATAALETAAKAGYTFTDTDGDELGDVWMHFEKLAAAQTVDADDDKPPF